MTAPTVPTAAPAPAAQVPAEPAPNAPYDAPLAASAVSLFWNTVDNEAREFPPYADLSADLIKQMVKADVLGHDPAEWQYHRQYTAALSDFREWMAGRWKSYWTVQYDEDGTAHLKVSGQSDSFPIALDPPENGDFNVSLAPRKNGGMLTTPGGHSLDILTVRAGVTPAEVLGLVYQYEQIMQTLEAAGVRVWQDTPVTQAAAPSAPLGSGQRPLGSSGSAPSVPAKAQSAANGQVYKAYRLEGLRVGETEVMTIHKISAEETQRGTRIGLYRDIDQFPILYVWSNQVDTFLEGLETHYGYQPAIAQFENKTVYDLGEEGKFQVRFELAMKDGQVRVTQKGNALLSYLGVEPQGATNVVPF